MSVTERELEDLRAKILQAFRDWCDKYGHSSEGWSLGEDPNESLVSPHAWLTNPIGVCCSDREVVYAQNRISDMARLPPAEIVTALRLGYLAHDGKPTLQIQALWNGTNQVGALEMVPPVDPAVLVTFEGEDASAGKWLEPTKVYRLLEFGYLLTNRVADDVQAPEEDETPF